MNIEYKPLSKENIELILQYISYFEKNNNFGEWKGGNKNKDGTISLPYFEYSDEVYQFIKLLYKTDFIVKFNWSKWDEGKKIINDKDLISQANLLTLRMLMTVIIRMDRFFEGSLLDRIKNGTILNILYRLKVLKDNREQINNRVFPITLLKLIVIH